MFDSPPRFYLDPWASEYGSALEAELEDDQAQAEPPETTIESSDWTAGIEPVPVAAPRRIVFVDGVQRVDAYGRILAEDRLVEAALASVAVGAVVTTSDSAEVASQDVRRVLAVAGGQSTSRLSVPVGGLSFDYQPAVHQKAGPAGLRLAIQDRRSDLERRCAESLAEPDSLTVLDGRLSFDPGAAVPLVGYVKTIHNFYLVDPEARLLPSLRPGERTPVFRIRYRDTTRYSWFLRLPYVRAIHHPFAGLVRLETPEIGAEAAIALAYQTAFFLPDYASRPEHDPRAPQNLMPVAALERRLRHEMGDPLFIRRAIEDYLYQGAPV